MNFDELEFLRESNNIEDVYNDLSLQQAILAWEYVVTESFLTPAVILKTHKILMLHQKLRPDEKGYFRKCAVWIGGRKAMDWVLIGPMIQDWCDDINYMLSSNHDFMSAEDRVRGSHVQYEKIHPFIDGNGRTGRIFMNWQRKKLGLPILIIKESEKEEYYKWF